MEAFRDEKAATKIDFPTLILLLTYNRDLEIIKESESEADEYLDTFVALGGGVDKEGYVSKEILIEIIKMEFELTIDMEDYLRKSGGDKDEITYYQFCRLLDAGTGGNPSRISSYLS